MKLAFYLNDTVDSTIYTFILKINQNPERITAVIESYNYDETDIHYYSAGGSYTRGRTRVAVNYGRQRGGLVCVGGVCRFVPENTGLTLNISTNF